MNARERYYFLRHTERLLNWQIAQVERERAKRRREFRRAWKAMILNRALRVVIADNLNVYQQAINGGF